MSEQDPVIGGRAILNERPNMDTTVLRDAGIRSGAPRRLLGGDRGRASLMSKMSSPSPSQTSVVARSNVPVFQAAPSGSGNTAVKSDFEESFRHVAPAAAAVMGSAIYRALVRGRVNVVHLAVLFTLLVVATEMDRQASSAHAEITLYAGPAVAIVGAGLLEKLTHVLGPYVGVGKATRSRGGKRSSRLSAARRSRTSGVLSPFETLVDVAIAYALWLLVEYNYGRHGTTQSQGDF